MAVSKGELNDNISQFMKKGQWKKALAAIEKLHAMDKGDPQVTLRMGDIYLKLNDKDNAAKSYIKTAGMFVKQGHTPKALATYKMVLRVAPSLTGVQDLLDELAGTPSKPGAMDKSKLKVDLSKAIPGLEDAAADMPEPPPIAEPDSTPVYQLDLPSGGGGPAGLDIRPGHDADEEFDEGLIGGSGSFEIDTGRAGMESPASSYEGGGIVLDTDISDEGGSYEGAPLEIDTGRADDGAGAAENPMGVKVEPVMDEAPADDEAVEEILLTPEPPPPSPTPAAAAPIPLLFDLKREELWELIGRMDRRTYKADEVIVKEGEEGDSLYIIKSGSVRVVTKVGEKEIVLARLGERDFFGEVSFLTGRPRTADIIADGPCEIMELSRGVLDSVIKNHPKVEGVLRLFHESRVADTVTSLKAVAKDFFK